jgi:hypothetical protein
LPAPDTVSPEVAPTSAELMTAVRPAATLTPPTVLNWSVPVESV